MKKLTNDHRTRVTKMLIRGAFTQLLGQKPIQSISIKELCELAGINRGTFYTHYKDIYDLRDQIEEEMVVSFEKAIRPLLQMDRQEATMLQITTEIFQCLKDHSDLCIVMLGEYGDKAFVAKLLEMGRERCVESYSKYFASATPQQIEYFYAFASAGCIGLLQKWLADGMTASAEEIAKMAENIMLHGTGFLN